MSDPVTNLTLTRVLPVHKISQGTDMSELGITTNAPDKLSDRFERPLRDLRLSLTDRCNLRCTYCMPREVFGPDYPFLSSQDLLSFDEIVRLVSIFTDLGVSKVRLTGGEPLLRPDLEKLIERLAIFSGLDLTLTTNGLLLGVKAEALKRAGLRRITVSLDALDDDIFGQMNGLGVSTTKVLEGINVADQAGLQPIKINIVVRHGYNESEIVPLARHFRDSGHILRFIEYMDVGQSNGWQLKDVVPASEILTRIQEVFPLEPMPPNYPGEVAKRWRYCDGAGEIGVIASVTQPFCSGCTRARLSADGHLFTCLFASKGIDLKTPLRNGASDVELRRIIAAIWHRRKDRYSEQRTSETATLPRIEMSYIGG